MSFSLDSFTLSKKNFDQTLEINKKDSIKDNDTNN